MSKIEIVLFLFHYEQILKSTEYRKIDNHSYFSNIEYLILLQRCIE